MRQYEVTFIVDPVLSGDEIKSTAKTYLDFIEKEGEKVVHVDEMGLKQLAYPINRRSSGVYYCIEFQTPAGEWLNRMELSLRRDERILRFLTVKLDKYGVKYNDDKRNGLIGKKKEEKEVVAEKTTAPAPAKEKKTETPTPPTPPPPAEETVAKVADTTEEE